MSETSRDVNSAVNEQKPVSPKEFGEFLTLNVIMVRHIHITTEKCLSSVVMYMNISFVSKQISHNRKKDEVQTLYVD